MRDFLQRVTVGTALTTTTETTCYTAQVQFVQLASIRATNKDTTTRNLTVSWYDDSAAASYRLLKDTPVQAGAHVHIPFEDGFTLRERDAVRAEASAANAFDVIVTIIETPGRLI
jgi:hypothetical protein